MSQTAALALLDRYYTAFNAGDWDGMLACLSDDVAHDINQGARQVGKEAFRSFLAHMERCYAEQLHDLVEASAVAVGVVARHQVADRLPRDQLPHLHRRLLSGPVPVLAWFMVLLAPQTTPEREGAESARRPDATRRGIRGW